MRRYFPAVAALLVLVPWLETVRASPPRYVVENLGTFNGLVPGIVGLNAAGQAVANVTDAAGNSFAVRYTDGFGWQALPGLSGYHQAAGINAAGDVVGYRITPAGRMRAFRYRDGLPVEDIAPLAGGSFTMGYAVNAAGDVVGYSNSSSGLQAFLAPAGLPAVALPSLNGGFALACAINDSGQVAGISAVPSGAQHGIRVDPGAAAAVDVPALDGLGDVSACAIDTDGSVGGQSALGSARHAFRFNSAGPLDLDTFGSTSSSVMAMAGGISVGWYTLPGGATRAFAYRDGDGSFDLNTRIDTPGWVLVQATGVNSNGVIAGNGQFNGADAAFRLTPVVAHVDTTAPIIAAHADQTAEASGPGGAVVTYSAPSTSDAVDGNGTATCAPVSGSTFALGATTVTCNASDTAGNAATATTFTITVKDTTAPVIAPHADQTAEASSAGGAVVSYSSSATSDAVDGDRTATCAPASSSTFALGTTTVTCNASDAAGNAATATTFTITVTDTTAPVIRSFTATPNAIWPPNGKMVAVSLLLTASDDVDAAPVCVLESISGAPASDYALTGPLQASVRAVKDNAYMFHAACRDRAGNTSRATATVRVSK